MNTSELASSEESIEHQIERSRLELLDMGLRANPQLNCRSGSQKVLDIVDEKSSHIYELMVVKDLKMSFLPIPKVYQKEKESDEQDRSFTYEPEEQTKLPPLDTYLEEKSGDARFSDSRLQTGLIPEKLDKSLLRIETEAHNLLQEQGIEVLYLALGFLKWYEDDNTQTARYAPLILIPVEMIRSSSREGFKIKYTGGDIGPNLTLAAKLSGEYNLKMPSFEEDLEPQAYYQSIKEAIANQDRWQVMQDKVSLSLFSFGKFQMYMDLDPTSWPEDNAPSQNLLLNKLLNDGFEESETIVKRAENHQTLHSPESILLVKDADSSQLESIIAAQEGADLIIQGPPGTGKSQTITNIIADSVGNGKKILFVAQKMAALEVVKKRLDECHLGHAVLELHSHKSTKKAVLGSLAQAMDQGKLSVPDRSAEYRQLNETKEALGIYVSTIQKTILQSNINYVDALGLLHQAEEQKGEADFAGLAFEPMADWNADDFENVSKLVQSLVEQLEHMGSPKANPFNMSVRMDVSPVDQKFIADMSAKCEKALQRLIAKANTLAETMGLDKAEDLNQLDCIHRAAKMALNAPELKSVKVDTNDWLILRESISEGLMSGRKMVQLYKTYEKRFIEQAFQTDLLSIRQGFIGRTDKWWRIFSSDYRNAKKQLSGICKEPLTGEPHEWLTWVDDLLDYQSQRKIFLEHENKLSELFGNVWQGDKSDWDLLNNLNDWLVNLFEQIEQNKVPRALAKFINGVDKSDSEIGNGISRHKNILEANVTLSTKIRKALSQLVRKIQVVENSHYNNLTATRFQQLQAHLTGWQDVDSLYQFARYNQLIGLLTEHKMSELVKAARNWQHKNGLLITLFELSYYQGLVSHAYESNETIKRFDRISHEKNLSDFRLLDEGSLSYAQEKLAEYIYQSLPKRHAKGEMEILMRELGKKSRHLPIRQLLTKSGNAIQQIKPIFMMSPMSISTYLAQGAVDFDLVIFDEASQIRAPDALGALLRGKQVIVVGDSKQMPPSDLFGKSVMLTDDAVEDSVTAEMESILSLMESKGVPQVMLRWHYRSRHDSLIAVSNNQFYDDRLLAFPSSGSQREAKGLHFHYHPENIYGEGGTASNWGEAKSIAQAVMRHAKKTPQLSLGVVAFGIVQRELIILEVERLRRENPECDEFFQHHAGGDEFFIKNLENVQGDERDVIYISVCYGRKADGKIFQNFGLINKVGGERRLNVLISRARLSMEVFANFNADELRVTDNSPVGLKSLQVFLRYAETRNFERSEQDSDSEVSPFEKQLFKAISNLGYPMEQQVGRQGFYLDLAIKKSDHEEQYLLAIESDGASYQNASSVRDRERLRASVLSGLGWRQHRVWSTDWYRNSESEIKRIVEAIEESKSALSEIETSDLDDADIDISLPREENSGGFEANIEREDFDPQNQGHYVPPYKMVDDSALGLPKVDDIGGIPTRTLANAIRVLVNGEAPIKASLLTSRLASAVGLARAGSRVKRQVEIAIEENINNNLLTMENGALFSFEKRTVVLRSWEHLPDNYRKLDNVCDAEIINALMLTVQDAYTIEANDAISGALSLLGFKRATASSSRRVQSLIDSQLAHEELTQENELLSIK